VIKFGFRSAACLVLGVSLLGCGSAPVPDRDIKTGGATKDDQNSIRGALDKAGIKGEIIAIQDYADYWQVAVSDPPKPTEPKPGERPKPGTMKPPDTYNISKKDFSVSDSFSGKKIK
jgi:hypothetical protein